MYRPVPLFVGLRYTRAKRRNHFISFISLTSILGLTLGVAVLIVVLSVMNGFDRELQRRILGMVPQASVMGYRPFDDWQALVDKAKAHPGVESAAPFIQLQGLLSNKGVVDSAFISGVMPEHEKEVSILPQHMDAGSLDDLKSGDFNIILGNGLARKLGLAIGDKVTLVLPEAAITPAGIVPRFKRFTLIGVFHVGAELDGMVGFVHLEDAARLARMPGQVEGVRLRVHDLFQAGAISWDIANAEQGKFYASDWTRTHGTLFNAIKMEKTIMGLLLTLVVAVAAFNIVSSLVMVVEDKKADIAILRTLGASPGTIMGIFMVQGCVIGLFGTLTGMALGITIALTISDFFAWLQETLHTKLMEQYFINYLPSELRWENVVFIASVGFLMSFLATLYPAWKASKMQPAEALRYE
ncbi:MAG TPA: lipoprotein-releasing ABC transporter permease subunit [Dongiaceae bacterium]|nr:lipoprotein-releasing ABC transporter permease subunit [Dongiaceae bacterium]